MYLQHPMIAPLQYIMHVHRAGCGEDSATRDAAGCRPWVDGGLLLYFLSLPALVLSICMCNISYIRTSSYLYISRQVYCRYVRRLWQ